MTDLTERIARYWAQEGAAHVARNLRAGNPNLMPAFTAIVGAERDAIGASEQFGDDDFEKLEWIIGFLGYPCKAEYVTAVTHVMSYEAPQRHPQKVLESEVAEIPDLQHAVLAWTYCVETETWAVKMMTRFVSDEGVETWYSTDVQQVEGVAARLIAAVQEFVGDSGPDEDRQRAVAADIVVRNNGVGYKVTFMPPGDTIKSLTAASN